MPTPTRSVFSSAVRDMDGFSATEGRPVLLDLIGVVHENAARLSAIDGATGDGDHGVNMDKGFRRAGELLGSGAVDLQQGLSVLGQVLLTEIGGSMGPLYGSFFLEMAETTTDEVVITGPLFGRMLEAGLAVVQDIGGAVPGDKTLLDSLVPATAAYRVAIASGSTFAEALESMANAADAGAQKTKEMVARVGRASRLGERSRGSLDAGAVSCSLILRSIANSMTQLLNPPGGLVTEA
jgi:dihydroxyacetone kinase-like protein